MRLLLQEAFIRDRRHIWAPLTHSIRGAFGHEATLEESLVHLALGREEECLRRWLLIDKVKRSDGRDLVIRLLRRGVGAQIIVSQI